MHENEFEKQVQQKMDQLGFDPPESVWSAVNREIRPDNKRRYPVFWFFLVAIPLLTGTAYYFLSHSNGNPIVAAVAISALDSGKTRNTLIESPSNSGQVRQPAHFAGISEHNIVRTGHPDTRAAVRPGSEKSATEFYPALAGKEKSTPDTTEQRLTGLEVPATENTVTDSMRNKADFAVVSVLPSKTSTDKQEIHTDSMAKKTGEKTGKKSSWKIGYTAGIGFSGTNQKFFGQTAYITNNNASPGAPPLDAELKNGFAYGIGFFVEKSFSDRISLSAGLNYRYFSSTGITNRPCSNCMVASGSSFTNQLYFIELPLMMDFKLNRSRKIPLVFEAGISYARLISSNSLFFDQTSGGFVRNSGFLQPNQWNGSSALLIGFTLGKTRIFAGPQLQAGLNSLWKNTGNDPGHLFYYGLKFTLTPDKD